MGVFVLEILVGQGVYVPNEYRVYWSERAIDGSQYRFNLSSKAPENFYEMMPYIYKAFNLALFDGKMPENCQFKIDDLSSRNYLAMATIGAGQYSVITFDRHYLETANFEELLATFVHEMCHVITEEDIHHVAHGKIWYDWMYYIGLKPLKYKDDSISHSWDQDSIFKAVATDIALGNSATATINESSVRNTVAVFRAVRKEKDAEDAEKRAEDAKKQKARAEQQRAEEAEKKHQEQIEEARRKTEKEINRKKANDERDIQKIIYLSLFMIFVVTLPAFHVAKSSLLVWVSPESIERTQGYSWVTEKYRYKTPSCSDGTLESQGLSIKNIRRSILGKDTCEVLRPSHTIFAVPHSAFSLLWSTVWPAIAWFIAIYFGATLAFKFLSRQERNRSFEKQQEAFYEAVELPDHFRIDEWDDHHGWAGFCLILSIVLIIAYHFRIGDMIAQYSL